MEIEARGAEWRAIYVGKKDQKSWEGVHSKVRERERERERERGVVDSLFYISLVRKMTWLSY